jgi:hypothetical protein
VTRPRAAVRQRQAQAPRELPALARPDTGKVDSTPLRLQDTPPSPRVAAKVGFTDGIGRIKPSLSPYTRAVWRSILLLAGSALAAGCSHSSGIVGTWKQEVPQSTPSHIQMFMTFNADGTFHREGRDSDRGDPVSRERGTYRLEANQLTEEFETPAGSVRPASREVQVWTATVSGDSLVTLPQLGGRAIAWRRTL